MKASVHAASFICVCTYIYTLKSYLLRSEALCKGNSFFRGDLDDLVQKLSIQISWNKSCSDALNLMWSRLTSRDHSTFTWFYSYNFYIWVFLLEKLSSSGNSTTSSDSANKHVDLTCRCLSNLQVLHRTCQVAPKLDLPFVSAQISGPVVS